VCHISIGNTGAVFLNTAGVVSTSSGYFNNTSPTSTVVTANQAGVGNANANMVAYCFAEVAGYSKIGSYVGNGSADGVFIYCGFRPAFFIVKSSTSADDWGLWDNLRTASYNPQDGLLIPSANYSEFTSGTYVKIDFLSNGIKLRNNGAENNNTGATYIYMAFAENPFKYSLAR
jgi:hypothetical protein